MYRKRRAITRVKHGKEGGVVICCKDDKAVENLSRDVKNKLGEEYDIKKIEKRNPKIKLLKVNPKDIEDNETFIEKLNDMRSSVTLLDNQNIVVQANELVNIVIKCLDKYAPEKNIQVNPRWGSNKWWNEDIKLAIGNRDRLPELCVAGDIFGP
ncbi:hypothetical protein NQ318_022163 [Aromia moschata]|uniref:Uncharacterized protein n=1 Tax=Aromia moschata TaxID=1265417 RepID=A0AAV8Z6Q9_9CUCU|nr:hypothetical protein NQ318_022163 [Aromia moschata]